MCGEYATIVPGADDVGNHCDDCATALTLPFTVAFYGQNYTAADFGYNYSGPTEIGGLILLPEYRRSSEALGKTLLGLDAVEERATKATTGSVSLMLKTS